LRATPAALCRWSACELLPARTAVHAALVGHAPLCDARCCCGAAFLACGRLSSRPWSPLPTALRSTQSPRCPQWSMPPGLPCRRSRRQSNTHPSCTGVPSANRPAKLRAPPQAAAPSGASRQACHAGGHAGRPTHTRAAREFQAPTGPQDCALHLKPLPQWSMPPGLPCRRSGRRSADQPPSPLIVHPPHERLKVFSPIVCAISILHLIPAL